MNTTVIDVPPSLPLDGRPGWKRWLIDSPLARIVIFAFFLAVSLTVFNFALKLVGLPGAGLASMTPASTLRRLVMIIPFVLSYWLLVRFIEKRRIAELAASRAPVGIVAGLVGGAFLFSVVVGVIALAGGYRIDGYNSEVAWIAQIVMLGIAPGITEEIVCRGVLFRIVEEGLGTWAALVISALVFGAAHLGNPNATLWSALAIAIEAGLLFGMLYNVTRSLWLCMGLHAAWNIMQGTVYGISVSGIAQKGWIAPRISGPDWLTGGSFGAEASVVALGCCSVLTVVLVVVALRRGTLIAPSWVRRRPEASNA
ncbi:type II CAAX endopeptidase family protein [Pinirhizobacter sp.]|uniref:CPBP family intramembrane glutamic endopeptidase n=1 Tax=Pinirhizobacter sp. TaxID=2950432 RepID=UPI002F40A950